MSVASYKAREVVCQAEEIQIYEGEKKKKKEGWWKFIVKLEKVFRSFSKVWFLIEQPIWICMGFILHATANYKGS